MNLEAHVAQGPEDIAFTAFGAGISELQQRIGLASQPGPRSGEIVFERAGTNDAQAIDFAQVGDADDGGTHEKPKN